MVLRLLDRGDRPVLARSARGDGVREESRRRRADGAARPVGQRVPTARARRDGPVRGRAAGHRQPPEAHDDGTYSLTVTYENGSDEKLRLDAASYSSPLAIRAGEADDENALGYDVDRLNHDTSEAALTPPLGEGDERVVPVRLKPPWKGTRITVKVTAPNGSLREAAHFQLTLG